MKPARQANVSQSSSKRTLPVIVPTAKSTIAKPSVPKSHEMRDSNAPGTARWGAVAGRQDGSATRTWSAASNEARREPEPEQHLSNQSMSFSARFHSNRASLNRYKLQDTEDFPTLATPAKSEAPTAEKDLPTNTKPAKVPAAVPKRKEASSSGFSWADISEDPEAEWIADDLLDRIKGDSPSVPQTNMWEERAKANASSNASEKDHQRVEEEKKQRQAEERAAAAEARRRQADEALARREREMKKREQDLRNRELLRAQSAEDASRRRAEEIKRIADDHKRILAEEKKRQEEYLKTQADKRAKLEAEAAKEKAKREAVRAALLQEQEENAKAELEAIAKQKEYMAELAREAERRRREEEETLEKETRERIAAKLKELEERAQKREEEERQQRAEEAKRRDAASREIEATRRQRHETFGRFSAERPGGFDRQHDSLDRSPYSSAERRDHGPPISVIEDDGREWRRKPREAFQPKRKPFGAHGSVRIQKRERSSQERQHGEAGESEGQRKSARVLQVEVKKLPSTQQASVVEEQLAKSNSREGNGKRKHKSARILSVHVLHVPRNQPTAGADRAILEGNTTPWAAPPPTVVAIGSRAAEKTNRADDVVLQSSAVSQRYEALRPPMADVRAPENSGSRSHRRQPVAVLYGRHTQGPELWDAQRPPRQPLTGCSTDEDDASVQPQWAIPVVQHFVTGDDSQDGGSEGKKRRKQKRRKKNSSAATNDSSAEASGSSAASEVATDPSDADASSTSSAADSTGANGVTAKRKRTRGGGKRRRRNTDKQSAAPDASSANVSSNVIAQPSLAPTSSA